MRAQRETDTTGQTRWNDPSLSGLEKFDDKALARYDAGVYQHCVFNLSLVCIHGSPTATCVTCGCYQLSGADKLECRIRDHGVINAVDVWTHVRGEFRSRSRTDSYA
jgi:hypothetical protein